MHNIEISRIMSVVWLIVAFFCFFVVRSIPDHTIYGMFSIVLSTQYNIAAMKF